MLETVSKLTNACASSLTISLTSLTITQAGLHRGREYLFHHGKQLCETTREGSHEYRTFEFNIKGKQL